MPRERLIPLVVAVALFMENMDAHVIATSLPAIARDLGTSPLTLKLAVTAYLLSLAVFIPASGWTADRFGARNVFRLAICVFMAGSLICATAGSLAHLIAGRIVEGMGAAMMAPVARLLILRTVDKRSLVDAMAWLTVPALMGPLLGPPLGGFITTYFAWQWIFIINIPIGCLGIIAVTKYIDDVRVESLAPIDVRGLLLCGIAVAGLAFGLSVAGFDMLPQWAVLTMVGVGSLAAFGFYLHARQHAAPALDFTLLRIPTFRAGVLGGSAFRIGIGAMPFLLPLLFQLGFGLNPLQSGLLTLATAVGSLMVKAFSSRIVHRFGFRPVLVINAVISGAFIAACAFFTPATPFVVIVAILFVGGFFRSLEFTCINALSFADIDSDRVSRATTMSAVWQQLSLSAGVAVGAFVVEYTIRLKGGAAIGAADFAPAFLVVGAASAAAAFLFMPLARDAGDNIAGRGDPVPVEKKPD